MQRWCIVCSVGGEGSWGLVRKAPQWANCRCSIFIGGGELGESGIGWSDLD